MSKVFARTLERKLRAAGRRFPVVFLTGPRQSGKTTLALLAFPHFAYASLEDLDQREFAQSDPRGFLGRFDGKRGVVLDEAQRAPDLFSYLQGVVDRPRAPRYVLTGSQQFQLSSRISQTLAGRAAVLVLHPLAVSELLGRRPLEPEHLDKPAADLRQPQLRLDEILFSGLFPRIHAQSLPPRDWLNGYVRTYVERDVRETLAVGDLETFSRFLMLCAGRTGQLLNQSALASDCGVSHVTIGRWLSVLEASGLLFRMRPHHANFRKRLVKAPKLYFLDTGLVCFLLGIRKAADLRGHPLHGAIFETFIVSELFKSFAHRGEAPPLFFWRDRAGREVDVLVDLGRRAIPAEVKLSETVRSDAFRGLAFYCELSSARGGVLIHGGTESYRRGSHVVRPWFACS